MEDDEVMMRDWCAVLGQTPKWAVMRACDDWLASEPTRRPTPAAIKKSALSHIERYAAELRRRKPAPVLLGAAERQPVDAERAKSILEEFGFAPKRMGDQS